MAIEMRRKDLSPFIKGAKTAHAGLLLRRGITQYDESKADGDKGKGGGAKQALIERIAGMSAPDGYRRAFARWNKATEDATRFSRFRANLSGRLYIGVDRDNALETGITVQHAWGMPMIPGSALKGLARSVARQALHDRADAVTWLFGTDTKDDVELESGAIVFHDAWWVPEANTKPFVAEIVTPHHTAYYNLGKAAATDFDSPIPAPQIAAQGQFLFVLEGEEAWRELARKLLQRGLAQRGIGGKRSSGYGYFDIPAN